MITLAEPFKKVWMSQKSEGLKYTWEIVEDNGSLVTINTLLPNQLVFDAFVAKEIDEFLPYDTIKREVKYGSEGSRIDFLLQGSDKAPCYVEVKQVHLRRQNSAVFPDGITSRGAKHLRELIKEVEKGNRAVVFYLIQRSDVDSFATACDIDPEYARTTLLAKEKGVEFFAYTTDVTLSEIKLKNRVLVLS
jgi:sugar fermentation stimulation protein A